MSQRANRILGVLGGVGLALSVSKTAQAGTASGSMSVNVTVQARALINIVSQPSSLEITQNDVRRGYVDVPAATRGTVRTNSPNGYLVGFETAQGPYKAIEVKGLGADAQIGAAGGWIPQAFTGVAPTTLELSYRFILAENAAPGSYAWPVSVSATAR